MTQRVFISQADIDTWVSADRAELTGDTLGLGGVRLRLTPAAHFLRVAGGGADPHVLVGKVKDQRAIAEMGGESYMSSVVVGEVAYDVDPGFLAIPVADAVSFAQVQETLVALGAVR